MEWVILLLLVPAIVIPVVLLLGFAGCSYTPPETGVEVPVITLARPLDAHTIQLEWTHSNRSDKEKVRFEILRTPEGPGPPPTPDQQSPFIDQQLDSGDTYSYRVRAVRLRDNEESDYSAEAPAVTWTEAFSADLVGAGVDDDVSNDCIIQRLDPGSLTRKGNLISIVGQAASNGDLVVTRASISDADLSPNADAVDSANQPTVIEGPFRATAGLSCPFPPTSYPVEPMKPLLIVFDVSTPGNTRFAPANFCRAFTKQNTTEQPVEDAAKKDRSDFADRPANEASFIKRIEVATEWRTT